MVAFQLMFVTIVVVTVTNAETETTDEARIHFTLTFHLMMPMLLDALCQVVDDGVIDFHRRLEHHTVDSVKLTVHVSIDKDDQAQLVLAVVFQQQAEEPRVSVVASGSSPEASRINAYFFSFVTRGLMSAICRFGSAFMLRWSMPRWS